MYILGINIANKQKEKYYHEYVPDLLDVRMPAALLKLYGLGTKISLEPPRPLRDKGVSTEWFVVFSREARNVRPETKHRSPRASYF